MSPKKKERVGSGLSRRGLQTKPEPSIAAVESPASNGQGSANIVRDANTANTPATSGVTASMGTSPPDESHSLRRKSLGLKAAALTIQRPYRLLHRQIESVKRILRSINRQLPDNVPDITLDELGRILHELFLEQKDAKATTLRLRERASNPSKS